MSTYTEFYVLPVKADKLDAYRAFAEASGKAWRRHGALSVAEYVATDAKPGVHTSFPQSVKLEADEVVAVAMIAFASQAECARIKPLVMADPEFADMDFSTFPVDGRRMFWGGFATLVTC